MGETLALGPATEALFRQAFSESALITAKAAAKLIGLDVKCLREMTDLGLISAVPRGSLPAYSEAGLRSYLANPPPMPTARKEAAPCPSTSRRKAVSGTTTSSSPRSGFMDRPARLRVVQPRPSSANGG